MLLALSCSQVFAATEILDQKQEIDGGLTQIRDAEPIGQSFIPTLRSLSSVEVYIGTSNPAFGDDTITCRISDSTLGGTVLGTASQFVTDGFVGWLRFTFDPPIIVNPGSTYVIELDANLATFGWEYAPGGNPYPDGTYTTQGTARADLDAMFRTYSLDAPVGGVIAPVNKLEIIAPYVLLAGLIIAVPAVIIKKRK
jgi:hypothetical protein